MSTTVLPVGLVGELMGRPVADVLGDGSIVMGATSAGLRGAQAGDTAVLVAADGSTRSFAIGLVADDATVGGTEIVMSPAQADSLGATTVTRLVVHGFTDRRGVEERALTAQGVTDMAAIDGQRTRVRRSWAPPDPDSTIGMARTKQLLGEFAYYDDGGEFLQLSSDWMSTRLPAERRWLFAYPGAPASSSSTIRASLQRRDRGRPDRQRSARCTPLDSTGRSTSPTPTRTAVASARASTADRQRRVRVAIAWGMAFDTNTTTNPQGGVPQMNCDVVRIFRRHNFAWGGNFTSRDGMHFEWVGERRDLLPYPRRTARTSPPRPRSANRRRRRASGPRSSPTTASATDRPIVNE